MEDLSTMIKKLKKKLGLTQQELADKTGLTLHRIKSIESGRAKDLKGNEFQIFKAMGISEYWLLNGDGPMFESDIHLLSTFNAPTLLSKAFDAWVTTLSSEEQAWLKIELTRRYPEFKEFLSKKYK